MDTVLLSVSKNKDNGNVVFKWIENQIRLVSTVCAYFDLHPADSYYGIIKFTEANGEWG